MSCRILAVFAVSSKVQKHVRLVTSQDPPTRILSQCLTSGSHEKRLPKDAGAVFQQALEGKGFCQQS